MVLRHTSTRSLKKHHQHHFHLGALRLHQHHHLPPEHLVDLELKLQVLLDSVLTPDPRLGLPNTHLGASYPNPIDPPSGCAFHPRCANAMPYCAQTAPNGLVNKDTYVECHLYSDGGVAKTG